MFHFSRRARRRGFRPACRLKLLAALPILGLFSGSAEAAQIQPMVIYTFGDRSFPANSFSASTSPSSSQHSTLIRVIGNNDLGDGFSFIYDLRYSFLYRSQVKGGVTVVDTRSGLQEQDLALGYALGKGEGFSHSVRLGVVVPASSGTVTLPLDSGHWALEPIYHIAFAPGFLDLEVGLDVGGRIFTDGGAAQFRPHLEIAAPVTERLQLAAEFTLRRSVRFSAYDALSDSGELSDFFRAGLQARYDLGGGIAPIVGYDVWVAGMGGHAYERFTVGVRYAY